MKFPYTRIGRAAPAILSAFPERPFISLPLLKFGIRYKDKSLKLSALVDSGADVSLFPMDIAEALEINLSKAGSFSLISVSGQAITVKLHEIEMMFDKYSFKIPVGFSTAAGGARNFGAAGIIGHRGFFDRFIVSFHSKEEYFEVRDKILFQI